MPPASTATTQSTAKRPMSYPHMAWAAGHALVLLGTAFCFLPMIGFAMPSGRAYRIAFAGAIISWTVVVFKSLGVPSLNRAYVQRAALDENAQYLLLALTWFFQKPIAIAVLPYAIFSFFHILNFVRQTYLPTPPKAAPNAPAAGFPAQLSKHISTFSKRHYEGAMALVAYIEIGVMIRVILGAVTFRNSLLTPIMFAHFLRFRYYVSQASKNAFGVTDATIQRLVNHPSCPPPVRSVVETAKGLIVRYADSVLAMPAGNAPAGGAARPQNEAEAHRAR